METRGNVFLNVPHDFPLVWPPENIAFSVFPENTEVTTDVISKLPIKIGEDPDKR